MQLLLVEDDPRLSQYMREALGREGYTLDVCASIEETQTFMALQGQAPRVIILDRMLGRDDGATLIPALKSRYPDAGILILSSLDMPSEKARVIDAGADEYLSKPFSLDELTARLRLVVRRSGRAENAAVRALGNLVLDLKTQNATVASARLDLTRKEFQLLSLLMDSPGRVYNRFQILDRVWEIERMTESNVVETTIKNLRRKLEEAGADVRIESKRNMGYWIET
ncbi:MAG: response regulator transcription factor [Bdellovibrionales bacterium]|nr:response regulator transcription factor [Bdellovibrionales bacterium]